MSAGLHLASQDDGARGAKHGMHSCTRVTATYAVLVAIHNAVEQNAFRGVVTEAVSNSWRTSCSSTDFVVGRNLP